MMEQIILVQEAIDWIEGQLEDEVTLDKISQHIGYSSYHTSRLFKTFTGSTLRNYLILRRLSKAAKYLRDHEARIIDVALRFQFSSQEAFTKSFKTHFGITPGVYKKNVKAVPLVFKKDILFPNHLSKRGDIILVKDEEIIVRLEKLPKHKLIFLTRKGVDNYIDFWEKVDAEPNMDCDYLHGMLASMPGIYDEGFGAFLEDGYLFGKDVPLNYQVDPSLGFKEIIIEEQQYLIFEHPGFKEAEFEEALRQVRRVALEKFDFQMNGYELDQSFVKAYEHSGIDVCQYFMRIPLKDM
jgi:AraC-like DNA-binding protein